MDGLVQPKLHKIIMYDFRKKPPEVQPVKKSGEFPRPRGAEISKQAVIATSPKPKSTQQMIWLPTPKIEVQKDVPLPNLIARMKTALPSLPNLPKEKPQPVVEAAKAVQPNTSPPTPPEAIQPPKLPTLKLPCRTPASPHFFANLHTLKPLRQPRG